MAQFDPAWDNLICREQERVLNLLIERVAYDAHAGTISLTFRPSGIKILGEQTIQPCAACPPLNENDMTVVCPVSFRRVESGRRRLNAGNEVPLPESASIPRVAKLMALALRFEKLVTEGLVKNYADLARLGGVSFARVSQIMNLLNFTPDIQEEILILERAPDSREPITEFDLRDLVAEVDWSKQRQSWTKLVHHSRRS